MNARSLSAVLALLVAPGTSAPFDLPPPWTSGWGPQQPLPGGPSARAAGPAGLDTPGGTPQSAPQSSFSPAATSSPSHLSFSQIHSSFSPPRSPLSQSHSQFPQAHSHFSESHSSFSQPHSPFSQTHVPFSQPHSPFSQFHSPFSQSQPSSAHSPFSSSSQSFSQPQSSFSNSHFGGSGFGSLQGAQLHSTQQHQECPHGTECVDEHLCPPHGRSASPRAFNAFSQPIDDIQPRLDAPHGQGSSHVPAGGGSCGFNKVCCSVSSLPPRPGHGPPPCRGPHCSAFLPHYGGYGAGYGGYGGYGGGYGTGYGGGYGTGYGGGYGPHSAYPGQYGAHAGYGYSGYYPAYPQGYGGGYSQYQSYSSPYYPAYPTATPYLPYPPFPSYPLHQRHPGPFGAAGHRAGHSFGFAAGHPDRTQAGDQGSVTSETEGGGRSAPSSRTSRMFF